MGELIALDEKRRRLRARRVFYPWERRFRCLFDEHTSVRDLPDAVLAVLIQPGEQNTRLVQSLVLRILTGESDADLEKLSSDRKILTIDVTLFLVDQIRFECMRRLGWVEADPRVDTPIVDLVDQAAQGNMTAMHATPAILASHPLYAEYQKTFVGDQGAFVRKLIPRAIEEFVRQNKS